MGIVAPERKRSRRPAPPTRRPEFPWGIVAALAAVIVLLVGVRDWLPDLIPALPNPFAEETIDRSRPAVLQSIRDLSEYRAATGHFEVIVDVEKDTALPRQILGERTLFVAVGEVDAVVDFSRLGARAVEVSDDRRSAMITLPQARLSRARLNIAESYVYDRERGILNELGSLFADSDDPEGTREVFLIAEGRLADAARESPSLRTRAQDNTRAMLRTMLEALGFERVAVRFG
jgi:hypothetical protein